MKDKLRTTVTQVSIETDELPLDILEPVVSEPVENTDIEVKLLGHIKSRLNAMRSKRTGVDKYWTIYQQMWDAVWIPYSDGRSRSQVPIEMAIIELFVAESLKRKTQAKIEDASPAYQKQAQAFERVWKFDWAVNEREKEVLANEYITSIFGTSVMFTGFEMHSRVISDPNELDAEGKLTFTRKLQTSAEIQLKNVDIRNFFVDEKAKKIEDANDCIYIDYIPEEVWRNYKFNPNYKNVDSCIGEYVYNDSNKVFVTKEERMDLANKFVKLVRYWDKEADMYVEMANDKTIVRRHPIMNASKSLPFVVRQYSHNPFSMYGRGICEILMTFKSDLNTLREMLMDAIKRSNQSVIAIGGNLEFDGNYFAYNNQILTFKGQMGNGNFNQLSWPPPNQAIFQYIESIFKDISIFTGIEIRNITDISAQTAYQTAVQKESQLSRINVILSNRDIAFQRLFNLHRDNIMQFYPIKLVRSLVEVDERNTPIRDMKGKLPEPTYPEITLKDERVNKNGTFSKSGGTSLFEITPETIRGKINVKAFTNLNAPTINEVEKELKMQFFERVSMIGASYAQNPILNQIIPQEKAIKDLADAYNIDTMTNASVETKKAKDALYGELNSMMQGTAQP